MNDMLVISPKTKVFQLLESYPELEGLLISLVPAFGKLRNPVLRNTIARITTLQQAAQVGNIDLTVLVNTLRQAAGQEPAAHEVTESPAKNGRPGWPDSFELYKTLDAGPMLAAGEHPVAQVMEDLKKLPAGKRYLLIAPFMPAPLIDKAISLGADYFVEQQPDGRFFVHFAMSGQQ